MTLLQPSGLQPRKTPQQTRSTATVDAIRTATIQVLVAEGPTRLTTTRVAARAGVSIGTMYQYFPHKQALLFAVLEQKLNMVEAAMLEAVERLAGRDLERIAHGLADSWLDAKAKDMDASRAIYAIAAEFDISVQMANCADRLRQAIGRLLVTTPDARFDDIEATAFMTLALLTGPTRAVLEHGPSERGLDCLRRELPRACYGYLDTVAHRAGDVRQVDRNPPVVVK